MYSPRKCKECGNLFVPRSSRQQYCDADHFRPCPVCGAPVLVKRNAFNDPPRCCSTQCTVELTRARNLEKYGTMDPGNSAAALEKRKQTNLLRYGVEDAGNRPEAKAKRAATCLARYGVTNGGASQVAKDKRAITNESRFGTAVTMDSPEFRHKMKLGMLSKYGVDNAMKSDVIKQRAKQTNLAKYGVPWAISSPIVREKSEHTMLRQYGTIHPTQCAEIQQKTQETCLKRYGVTHHTKTAEWAAAYEATLQARYGVSNIRNIPGVDDKIVATNLERYGLPYAFMSDAAHMKSRETMLKNMKSHISKFNRAFSQLLTAEGIDHELEFYLDGKWFDIVIPDQHVVIEIDPTYTHSTEPSFFSESGLDKYYHRDKTHLAETHGYRCIHVFDWDDPKDIIKLVTPRTRLHARCCDVELLDKDSADSFLQEYHIQHSVANQLVRLGLIYRNELVAVMSFGHPRYNTEFQWELLRFASLPDKQIVGGASKLFSHFCRLMNPESVLSYCNRAKFRGGVYSAIGMQLYRSNSPSRMWSKGNKVITDALLRQRGFDQLFGTSFGKGTNNDDLMRDAGWRSVYDCGQAVYVYRS